MYFIEYSRNIEFEIKFFVMAALLPWLLSVIKRDPLYGRHIVSHVWDIPLPKILHKSISSNELENYREVFVIGDVHGCFDELMLLLEKADAFNDLTLKIFVGDVVNKGPKSSYVLNFLKKSDSILAVRGNHDEVVLREYFNAKQPDYKLSKENAWIKYLTPEDIEYLIELPYTITLESLNAIIVHAGLVPGKPLENNELYDMVTMRNLISSDYFWEGLHATKDGTKGEPWASLWPGPKHIYFGHDAKRMLQLYPHATGLDTGCVYGKKLTGLFISGHRKGTYFTVDALKTYQSTKKDN